MIDFRVSAKVRLLELLHAHNLKNRVVEDDVVFSQPVTTTEHGRNTKVVLTAKTVGRFTGKRTIFYNRLELGRIPQELGVSGEALPMVNSTHELLPYILSQFGLNLLPEDIVLEPLTTIPYTLTATAGSYGWVGSVTLTPGLGVTYEVLALDDGSLFATDDNSLVLIDENLP